MKTPQQYAQELITFLDASPVNFYAAETVRQTLLAHGFVRLDPRDHWTIEPGGRYYVTYNGSAIFAFVASDSLPDSGFKIISAHSDSPGFRIKPNPVMRGEGGVIKLNTEVYGGPILYTWFDRPLSIAGRVLLRSGDSLNPHSELLRVDRPLLTIPHLAIHFNRKVNEGNPLSKQKDMLPVLGFVTDAVETGNMLTELVASEMAVDTREILDFDLSLYDTTGGTLFGMENEYISSGRLDDLSMVHAALTALVESAENCPNSGMTRVMAIFDNEETGSGTKQGANSPILHDILLRYVLSRGGSHEDFLVGLAHSFMVSADNAHAWHPNYSEKYDLTNHPVIGGGPVIKINANCKYMTDADSSAVFRAICEDAGVPYQYFVNHSDVAGGSTLGNILTSKMAIRGVDMGAALWAMHSIRETAGVADHSYVIRAFRQFYNY